MMPRIHPLLVMAGRVPAIHTYRSDVRRASVDARNKSGHDE
jgi:hypothetical protein